MLKTRRPIAIVTAAAAFAAMGAAGGTAASAAEPTQHGTQVTRDARPGLSPRPDVQRTLTPAERTQMERVMRAVEHMPKSVADGGQRSVQRYLQQHAPAPDGMQTTGWWDGWWDATQCVASIAALVAGVALPASKILKLKAFIKKTGSVREAAELLIKVSTGEEKLAELGPVIGGLAAEILGISSVQENCS